jgi:hypothetical protein
MRPFEALLNVLDILAFALVTTELYGIDRLEHLRQRILAVKFGEFAPFELFKDQKTGKPFPLRMWVQVALALVGVITGFWLVGQVLITGADVLRGRGLHLPPLEEVEFLFFVLGLMAAVLLLMYLVWFARAALVPGLIYLTKLFKIQGMMIVTGSVIYLVARGLAIAYDLTWP